MLNMDKLKTGSISHGTLRPEDLASAFLAHAEYLEIDVNEELASDVRAIAEGTYIDDDPAEVLIELGDLIDESLPTFLRFGTHEGDGSDWGIWASDIAHSEELVEALLRVERAKFGDSNDEHIEALEEALDEALALIL